MKKIDFILTGVGGQGTILASNVLTEVGLALGYDVKKAEVLGMSQRGGTVESHVRWGEKVYSPLIEQGEVDYLLGFEMLEAGRWPLYIKKGYKDDPCFKNTKVVYSVYDEDFKKPFKDNFAEKLRFDTIGDAEIETIKARGEIDYVELNKLAIDYSDGVIYASENINPEVAKYISDKNIPSLSYTENFEEKVDKVDEFYKKIDE